MATVTCNNKSVSLPDNRIIRQACEDLDIPFACQSGFCGICQVEIIKGEENLNELSPSEKELGMDKTRRLACQACLKHGELIIKQ